MPTNVIENSKVGDIRLGVSVSGLVVTVESGAFRRMEKVEVTEGDRTVRRNEMVGYELTEDWTHTVEPDADEDISVVGYLAKRESDGAVVLITDQVSESGSDLYGWRGSGYVPLHALYTLFVPASSTELDVANLAITHHQAPEE